MPRQIVSEEAQDDLHSIYAHIADGNLDAALRLMRRFDEAFELLARHSQLGRERPELMSSVRSFAVGNYVILYAPTDDTVEILHVYHGRRDIGRIMRRRP